MDQADHVVDLQVVGQLVSRSGTLAKSPLRFLRLQHFIHSFIDTLIHSRHPNIAGIRYLLFIVPTDVDSSELGL